jgi:hypothetical protein
MVAWLLVALVCLPSLGAWHKVVHGAESRSSNVLAHGLAENFEAQTPKSPHALDWRARAERLTLESAVSALFAGHDGDAACLSFDQSTSLCGLKTALVDLFFASPVQKPPAALAQRQLAATPPLAQARAPPLFV